MSGRPATEDDLTALEKVFNAKLSSLRAWGVAALVGGQAFAAFLAALITRDPMAPLEPARAVLSFLGVL